MACCRHCKAGSRISSQTSTGSRCELAWLSSRLPSILFEDQRHLRAGRHPVTSYLRVLGRNLVFFEGGVAGFVDRERSPGQPRSTVHAPRTSSVRDEPSSGCPPSTAHDPDSRRHFEHRRSASQRDAAKPWLATYHVHCRASAAATVHTIKRTTGRTACMSTLNESLYGAAFTYRGLNTTACR